MVFALFLRVLCHENVIFSSQVCSYMRFLHSFKTGEGEDPDVNFKGFPAVSAVAWRYEFRVDTCTWNVQVSRETIRIWRSWRVCIRSSWAFTDWEGISSYRRKWRRNQSQHLGGGTVTCGGQLEVAYPIGVLIFRVPRVLQLHVHRVRLWHVHRVHRVQCVHCQRGVPRVHQNAAPNVHPNAGQSAGSVRSASCT